MSDHGTRDDRKFIPAAHYDLLTPVYDLCVGTLMPDRRIKESLIAQAELSAGHVVLDVGCGTGTLLLMLALKHPEIHAIGIDPDPRILAIARRKATRRGMRLELVRGMAGALPHADESIDHVLTSLALHHLSTEGKAAFFRESLRVLRPGGSVHVADFGRPHSRLMRMTQRLLELADGAAAVADNLGDHLPGLMREAGLADVAERTHFATAFGSVWLWSGMRA